MSMYTFNFMVIISSHRYNFQDEIMDALDSLRNGRENNSPNVGGAFDYVRNSMFTTRNGDRPKAKNFVVLLTGK